MDQYLSLLNHYENVALLDLEYCMESNVLIMQQITNTLLIIPRYIDECFRLFSVNKRINELNRYKVIWENLQNDLSKEYLDTKVVVKHYPALADKTWDYEYKMVQNLDALFRVSFVDDTIMKIRESILRKQNFNDVYEMPIDAIFVFCEDGIERLQNERDLILKKLKNPSMLKSLSENELNMPSISNMIKGWISSVKRQVIAFMFNLCSIKHAIADRTMIILNENDRKKSAEILEKINSGNDDEINSALKPAKYIKEEYIGNAKFRIYQLPYKNIGAFNYLGENVYVDANFFKYSKPLQRAILLHEFGHYMTNQFQMHTVPNERERLLQMSNDISDYLRIVKRSKHKDALLNDDDLIYILIELDADRYASKFVGKSLVNRAVRTYANNILHVKIDDSTEEGKLLKAYNQERFKIRAALV